MKGILIMKRQILLFAVASFLSACTLPPMDESPPPVEREPVVDVQALQAKVTSLAVNSDCHKAAHDVQGTPPQGYMKGIALTYARGICRPSEAWVQAAQVPLGPSNKDALTHYGVSSSLSAAERLDVVFALILGSSARESSWRWCVGRDTLAKESDRKGCVEGGGETCEAGHSQGSYNSIGSNTILRGLFTEFGSEPAHCFAKEYKGATTCTAANLKNWGSNPKAVEFQRLSKHCPGFPTQSKAVLLRTTRTHFGPINKKQVTLKPQCVAMFSKIRQAIASDPAICKGL